MIQFINKTWLYQTMYCDENQKMIENANKKWEREMKSREIV